MKIIGFILYFLILTFLFIMNYNFGHKTGYDEGYTNGYVKGHIDGFDFARNGDVSGMFKNAKTLKPIPNRMEDK